MTVPNRIIREGILTSPKLAKLGWAEEVFYRRLLSVVDDFGRYYADPGMLRAACYPRQLNKVSDSDVGKWLGACSDAALVRVYPAEDGERYLEVVKFDQQVRAKKSKFPQMTSTCVTSATQTPANAHLDVFVDVDVDECVTGAQARTPAGKRKQQKRPIPDDFAVSERVRSWAAGKGHSRLDQHLEAFIAKARKQGYAYADWDAALMEAIRENWANLPVSTSMPSASDVCAKSAADPAKVPKDEALQARIQQARAAFRGGVQ